MAILDGPPADDYDVIVIGGGSAGTSAGAAASAAGARTLVINDGELGGLCILRGCMPTKAMLVSAEAYEELRHLEPLGVSAGQRAFDFAAIMDRKDAKVARFKRAKVGGIESAAYDLVDARGALVGGSRVAIGERVLTARRGVVLAVGSRPSLPPIEGLDQIEVATSDEVMAWRSLPRSAVVQGGGAIGLELAWFLARLGCKVHLVNRSPLLSKIEPEFTPLIEAAWAEHADVSLHTPCAIERVSPIEGGIRFETSDGVLEAERFVCAVGRQPALEGLGLEAAGVEHDRRRVAHNAALQTSNPQVYVAGDATGSYQILHLSNQEGRVAGHNAAVGAPEREQCYRLKSSVIFTDPPVASVGMTEAEARAAGIEPWIARKRFDQQGRGIVMETARGLIKLLADPRDESLIGCQIFGPRADDLIHIAATMMHFRGLVSDVGQIPWYHPTLAEAFIELGRELVALRDRG